MEDCSKLMFTPPCSIFAQVASSRSIAISENICLDRFLAWPENYLPTVALGRRRGGGALVNRCGGLVHGREAPVLRAHGAALGASLVVMVVRHGRHQLALWTSLSTGPHRSRASSDTSSRSVLVVHLKHRHQEVTL